mmetsp:Transcript_8530/g.35579  ORF Transcript_8530/g.35579 Transcript_8530/m.35579 type:complete len:464 (-) Transcript_8530:56-1447(-)
MTEKSICCIGAGYVGGCTMAVIAKHCPEYQVIVCDINEERIAAWNSDNLPIFEPKLKETIEEAKSKNKNLSFTTDVAGAIKQCKLIFVGVSTPTKTYGRGAGKAFDMSSWEAVSRAIAAAATSDKILVEKSTVPVRTAEKVKMILNEAKTSPEISFQVVSNPEFLAEGSAIDDLEVPDRVLIGGEKTAAGDAAVAQVAEIYAHWVPREKIVTTNLWTSELSKLASNAFLAQRISSINAISALCEEAGADVRDVSRVLGMDDRIGRRYLSASVGFGGSCLKKDVLALVYICESYQLHQVASYWQSIVEINEFQKQRFATRVLETMYGTVRGKKLCILGFAFKADTGDTRETCAIEVIRFLVNENADIHIYDPKVTDEDIKCHFPSVTTHTDAKAAMDGAHALVVLTEWKEFRAFDFEAVYASMKKPAFVFDGRNLLDVEQLTKIGFHVHTVGTRGKTEKTHIVL